MEALRLFVIEIGEKFAAFRVVAVTAQLIGSKSDAGEKRLFATERCQRDEDILDIVLVVTACHIGLVQHKASLCKVGDDNVRRRAELCHLVGKIRVEALVERAVVAHCGVYKFQFSLSEVAEDGKNQVDLALGTEVSGINTVKIDALVLPSLTDRLDVVGQIAEGEAIEGGMGGKHRGGKDRRLDAKGGDDGERDGKRAFADAGDVLDTENSFHFL